MYNVALEGELSRALERNLYNLVCNENTKIGRETEEERKEGQSEGQRNRKMDDPTRKLQPSPAQPTTVPLFSHSSPSTYLRFSRDM